MSVTTEEEKIALKEGGNILATIIRELVAMVKPGVTTGALNERTNFLMNKFNVKPAFLKYNGYPAVVCTSVNEEAVHAVPYPIQKSGAFFKDNPVYSVPSDSRVLKEGDLLKIDCGVIHKNIYTDSAVTVLVSNNIGQESYEDKKKLIRATEEALYAGISKARAGNHVGDIGFAVSSVVKKYGYIVLEELGGHGVGKELHEDPFIPNFGTPGNGPLLKNGMVIAIEPITSMGRKTKVKESRTDDFGLVTKDNALSAHFEHTILITENDPIVLTK